MEHARPPSALSMAEGGPVSRADAWKRWKQQFMIFLKASGVQTEPASVQSGFDVYETFTFEKEEDKDDICVLLKKFDAYFDTKGNITLTRYKFFTRVQEDGESIQQYVTALRLISKYCNFACLEEELIKDRIVCGVRNHAIRDRLLRCEDLSLDKAIKICQAEEVSRESDTQLRASVSGQSAVQCDRVAARRRLARAARAPLCVLW
ncbi:unnamed protein product [Leptosia nina]|uniref:Retrotransposon gag domain-containing protein n=1 Tax=Leptosia nina TaxID=320188 RepID=A0AAV1JXF2_9NEOP